MSENQDDNVSQSESRNTGSATRLRTQSENDDTEEAGVSNISSSATGKRQRTDAGNAQYMVTSGLTAASPPKFVSLEEIMQAANSMKDMALVHQIVVDENFKLERANPEPNSIQHIVKETMHKAFWNILKQELEEDPPQYKQALILLEDIKEGLFAVLLPQHTKIKQQIAEVLDTDLIKQQAENGTLDFSHYAQYVISVMAKLCAPVRDERIQQLTQTTDIIETFRGILETLDLMKLDMANFTLAMAKPGIIAASVELERKKFSEFLAVQSDGLEFTRKWLLKHVNTNEAPPANIPYESHVRNVLKRAFWEGCMDLLDWPDNEPYPETFIIDEKRLRELQVRTKRLTAIGTVLLVTLSNVGADLQSIAQFKTGLKDHVTILLQNVTDNESLSHALPNVADQIVNDVKEAQLKYNLAALTDENEKVLRDQVLSIGSLDNKIRQLIYQRIMEFFQEIIASSTAAPQKVPTGLTALQKELTATAGQFLKIVSHNNTVFCIYYYDIVAAAIPKS